MKSEIPVKFETPVLDELPVLLKKDAAPAKPKPKARKAMADVQAFSKFGVQVLRVKAKVLAALGKEAQACGIKQIGHGKILLTSDNAEEAIAKVGSIVDKMLKQPNPDYDTVLEFMRLQHEFNGQLLKTAEAHFNADRQPVVLPQQPPGLTVPFPPGSAVMIGPGKVPTEKLQSET